jgi:uncharacterized protein (TIGR00730 family)
MGRTLVSRKPLRERRRKSLAAEMLPRLTADEPGLTREEELVREMVETSLRLLRDGTPLGDVKLLNSALRELRYAFKVFAPYRHVHKVSVFGSARTAPPAPAYKAAVAFSQRLADAGYMLITGAGNGIMRACNEGAGRDRSFGVNIRLPFEQAPNEFIREDPKLVTLRYFFTRKLVFIKEAHGVALFPGGFGTHDEAYETLTLVQTGKTRPMPIVFVDGPRGTYWKTWKRYVEEHLLRHHLISQDDMDLFLVTSDVEEAVAEITGFYRVYHSSRYVGPKFVIRLHRPLPAPLVQTLAHEFKDLLVAGTIEQKAALPEEREQEPDLNDFSRLVLELDRAKAGRLRQLINRVNREG